MATQAQKLQRARRRRKKKEHLSHSKAPDVTKPCKGKHKSTGSNIQAPIKINSDGEGQHPIAVDSDSAEIGVLGSNYNESQPICIEIPNDNNENDEITYLQELEMKEIDQANHIMEFVQASLDDDDRTDKGETSNNKDEPHQALFWSVFERNKIVSTPSVHRILKSGKKGYQKPTKNPLSNSSKLIPAEVSQQTRHDQKKKHQQAVGKDNNIMLNWLKKAAPQVESLANLTKNSNNDSTRSPQVSQDQSDQDDTQTLRLQQIQNDYLGSQNLEKLSSTSVVKHKAQTQWEQLQKATDLATDSYKQKGAQDKTFQYPKTMLVNLREFNYLQKQYTMQGIKNPSLEASKQTAQSSIRRHGPSRGRDGPENPQSGLHLARTISKQARFIVNNNLLLNIKRGNQSNQKSLINNLDVRRVLFTWSASQTPGKVSYLYFY
jgi:hypothetical protein